MGIPCTITSRHFSTQPSSLSCLLAVVNVVVSSWSGQALRKLQDVQSNSYLCLSCTQSIYSTILSNDDSSRDVRLVSSVLPPYGVHCSRPSFRCLRMSSCLLPPPCRGCRYLRPPRRVVIFAGNQASPDFSRRGSDPRAPTASRRRRDASSRASRRTPSRAIYCRSKIGERSNDRSVFVRCEVHAAVRGIFT